MNNDVLMNCPACHIGRLNLRKVTYTCQYGETLVNVPNMSAWVCDVCHEQHYDPSMLFRLELLIGQSLLPPNRYRPASRPTVNHPDNTDSALPKAKV
jgi:YgiT-type zinc finger domain-containing protein